MYQTRPIRCPGTHYGAWAKKTPKLGTCLDHFLMLELRNNKKRHFAAPGRTTRPRVALLLSKYTTESQFANFCSWRTPARTNTPKLSLLREATGFHDHNTRLSVTLCICAIPSSVQRLALGIRALCASAGFASPHLRHGARPGTQWVAWAHNSLKLYAFLFTSRPLKLFLDLVDF